MYHQIGKSNVTTKNIILVTFMTFQLLIHQVSCAPALVNTQQGQEQLLVQAKEHGTQQQPSTSSIGGKYLHPSI